MYIENRNIIKSKNGLFAVDPLDKEVSEHLRKYGCYGIEEINRIRPFISSESRILIVGAHIGTLAIPLSKLCKNLVAIEANPHTFALLETNIELNFAINIEAINVAANDKEESLSFLLNTANSGGSKREPKIKEYMYYYDNPETITVQGVKLDKYIEEKGFDIIVMDIEGSEYFALSGMQEILSTCKLLVVEFLPHHLKNVGGVTVEQFLSVIDPIFSTLIIPSKRIQVKYDQFSTVLTSMFNQNQGDDGIMFIKN